MLLVGHNSTVITELIYHKQLRPVPLYADSEDPSDSPKVAGTNCAGNIATCRVGAARIVDWLPVWLSESESRHPAGPRPRGGLLYCMGFQPDKPLSLWQLAGLHALKDDF